MSYQPPTGGYGPPTGGYGPPPGGFGGQPQQPPGDRPKTYLVHNILGILSCIPVLGIIGLVFSLQVNSKWDSGDFAGAQDAAKTAKTLGIISLVLFILGAVIAVIYIVLMFIGIVLVGSASTTTTYY
ncbi:CD225/dispanin family protein [Nocardiopsis changdeensis]|uniref:CD225/dispanin family protein n=1 Tax=Nocardiopsis changdeensis TaxID=2831969 RepID=A0ABX8BJK2_9ACTN|nr:MULTISPECIES: CD225/dispanin family protein [Nocardiopsis]QUX21232.1 CD225/dispanin family protein [Nocardiopsis changdeensis]QYX37163.1 CD225/dispanin family protein [Nocardiopsis sp. MT53]